MGEPDRDIAGFLGRTGSGKTTLMKVLAARKTRVLAWDWRGSKDDFPDYETVGLRDLPAVFKRRRFHVAYRPGRGSLVREFEALAWVVEHLGHDILLIVDEVSLVVANYDENAVGTLLRFARPQGVSLYWATQEPTHIPSILRSECRLYYLFHLDDPTHRTALRTVLKPGQWEHVVSLPQYEYLTIIK